MKNVKLLSMLILILAWISVFAMPVNFIDGENAAEIILSELPEPCVPRLPAFELSIGEGTYGGFLTRKAGTDCREAFAEALREFTDEEKETLTRYVELIDSVITAEFPALNSFPWNFAVISDSADFGVPSSDSYIVLTKGLLKDLQNWMEGQGSALFAGMEILVREKVRLLQAMRPEPFERFYKETWEFRTVIPPLSVGEPVQDGGFYFNRVPANEWAIRLAPRGREFIIPALLLRDVGRGAGGTAQRVAVMADSTAKGFLTRTGRRTLKEYRDLRQFPQYRKKFPLSDYDYHPAELSADLLAKFLVMHYVSARYGTAPARAAHYSQIDVLMKLVEEAGAGD